MVENIKFRELRGRIDNILLQLSGLSPQQTDRIGLLESLFKEFKHELNKEEVNNILNLFTDALKQENMVKGVAGRGYEERLTYTPSQVFLNEIELELRRLLGKYGFYSLTREVVDYQLGEF